MKHTVNKLKWGLSTLHDCDGVVKQVPQLDMIDNKNVEKTALELEQQHPS